MPLRRKNLNRPDEVREFPKGRTEIFNLGDTLIGRQVFETGWRWSTDNQPAVGTEWCEVFHQGLVISGRLRVAMSDGPELEVGPGDGTRWHDAVITDASSSGRRGSFSGLESMKTPTHGQG